MKVSYEGVIEISLSIKEALEIRNQLVRVVSVAKKTLEREGCETEKEYIDCEKLAHYIEVELNANGRINVD